MTDDKRIDVRWGDYSQIQAELVLFEESINNEKYAYYHLLSGHDLPIKSQDYIHHFFSNLPKGTNLIGTATTESNVKDCISKTSYYCLLPKLQRPKNQLQYIILQILRKSFNTCQKNLRISRNWNNMRPRKGANWVSITSELVNYILCKKEWIADQFKYISCGDEIFIQTLVHNSEFVKTLYKPDEDLGGCLREIDWTRGTPYTYTIADLELLIHSNRLFARKFSYDKDSKIIETLCSYVKG